MKTRAAPVAALLLVLSFVVGSVTGMVLEEALGIDWFDFLDADEHSGEQALLRDLDLSADQSGHIEAIVDEREDRLESYWESQLPEIMAIIEASRSDIRAVLTPSQVSEYDRGLGRLAPQRYESSLD